MTVCTGSVEFRSPNGHTVKIRWPPSYTQQDADRNRGLAYGSIVKAYRAGFLDSHDFVIIVELLNKTIEAELMYADWAAKCVAAAKSCETMLSRRRTL